MAYVKLVNNDINYESYENEEELKYEVRRIRNLLLYATDFSRLDDVPLTEEERESYKKYRVYLRNFTEQDNWWNKHLDDYEEWLVNQ